MRNASPCRIDSRERPAATAFISVRIPAERTRSRYASAVTAKPFGIFTPFGTSSRYISPREAFFPPTRGTSLRESSPNQRMYLYVFPTTPS
jgi:hypothetical protein